MKKFLYNISPFTVMVCGVKIQSGYGDMLDVEDPSVIRMLDCSFLSENKPKSIDDSLTVSALNSDIKVDTNKEDSDVSIKSTEFSEICDPSTALYEGLPRVEPFNRRSGNKRPSDSMGGY